jgi:hypothetical protein
VSNKPTIYTLGDSHCWHTWLKIPNVITGTCGPMTMYSFGKDRGIYTESIPKDSIVVFSWGEIDCRCHVHKYQPWQQTVDSLVENYFKAVDLNVVGRDSKLVWIYNVVPPIRNAGESPSFPFLGTLEERIEYVRRMNQRLSETKYTFIDLQNEYANPDGSMKDGISDLHVHVEDEKALTEWIDKNVPLTY